LPENPEVNYASHPYTYDFLIIIKLKTTNVNTRFYKKNNKTTAE